MLVAIRGSGATDHLTGLVDIERAAGRTAERTEVDHAVSLRPQKGVLVAIGRVAPAYDLPSLVDGPRGALRAAQRAKIDNAAGWCPQNRVRAAGRAALPDDLPELVDVVRTRKGKSREDLAQGAEIDHHAGCRPQKRMRCAVRLTRLARQAAAADHPAGVVDGACFAPQTSKGAEVDHAARRRPQERTLVAARRVACADDVASVVDVVSVAGESAEGAEIADGPRLLRVRHICADHNQQADSGPSRQAAGQRSHLIASVDH